MGVTNRFKLVVLGLAFFVGLAGLEGLLRWRAHRLNAETLQAAFFLPPAVARGDRVRFIDIIREHPNPRIIYELRPNLDTTYKAKRLTTDAYGFRGGRHEPESDPNTVTIVGIGASIMFGQGVADGEEYVPQLELALNEQYPERTWRVINTSVPSYNVVMKVETLVEKGLAFDPDFVILNVASNNLELPNYIRVADDPLSTHKSFVVDFIGERLRRRRAGAELTSNLAAVEKDKLSWHQSAATDPEKIPAEYRDLVGWEPFERALDRLRDLSHEHGFEVLVFANLDLDVTSRMLREARERGFFTVTLMDSLTANMRDRFGHQEFSLEHYLRSDLVVGRGDAHPSALQHRMITRLLFEELANCGAIERLLAK